jgi:hypothetical protein
MSQGYSRYATQIQRIFHGFNYRNKRLHATIQIQRISRGLNSRNKKLPTFLYVIQQFLINNPFNYCNSNDDGRTNSCMDEDTIKSKLKERWPDRIYIPTVEKKKKKKNAIRCWYDIAIKDYRYGWLPVNIKTTTTHTSDNIGNFSTCVQAYTNTELDLNKSYNNSVLTEIFFNALEKKEYNNKKKKDYYFLVCNKKKPSDIIVNSMKGLTKLTPNSHNLPFQVRWDRNKQFNYQPNMEPVIKNVIKTIQKPPIPWNVSFLNNMLTLPLPN